MCFPRISPLIAICCVAGLHAGEQRWRIEPLPFGGLMNNLGQVAGIYQEQLAIYDDGDVTFLGATGDGLETVAGVNDLGDVVGSFVDDQGITRPFLFDGTSFVALSDAEGFASAINNNGEIIGGLVTGDLYGTPIGDPYIYADGTLTTFGVLEPLNGEVSRAHDVNDDGLIVGRYGAIPFLGIRDVFVWNQNDDVQDIGLPEQHVAVPTAVNSAGNITIDAIETTHLFTPRGFVYLDGAYTQLGHLVGPDTSARDINDADHVIGTDGPNPRIPTLWRTPDNPVHLGTELSFDQRLRWRLDALVNINNRGQIHGVATFEGNTLTPFLMSPLSPDTNFDGIVDISDILSYLASWFDGRPSAEFDAVPGLDLRDLLRFLSDWFAS